MTVAEMLARISSRELTEWMLFWEVEPFGTEANFLGHAITASAVVNVNLKKGKRLSPAKFMPEFGHKKEQSTEDMINMAAHITQAFGGEDKRK